MRYSGIYISKVVKEFVYDDVSHETKRGITFAKSKEIGESTQINIHPFIFVSLWKCKSCEALKIKFLLSHPIIYFVTT